MNEEMGMICFQMIASAGEAKSNYMEAMQAIKDNDFEKADELIKEGEKCFIEAHKVHAELVQKECAGESIELSLLMVHVEDQIMSVEIIKIMLLEMYDIYKAFLLKEDSK